MIIHGSVIQDGREIHLSQFTDSHEVEFLPERY